VKTPEMHPKSNNPIIRCRDRSRPVPTPGIPSQQSENNLIQVDRIEMQSHKQVRQKLIILHGPNGLPVGRKIGMVIQMHPISNNPNTRHLPTPGIHDIFLHYVRILIGKPDKINLHSIGSSTFEEWGYKIKNKYFSDLNIEFVDGRLKDVREYDSPPL
jgi:hypothetical protein